MECGVEEQSLTAEDQLFVLMQAGLYLTATRGLGAPEAQICHERVVSLCHPLNRLPPYSALIGQWPYSLVTDKLSATMQIAKRIYPLAQERNDPTLLMGAYRALANTLYFSGKFELARQYAMRGLQIRCSGIVKSPTEEVTAYGVVFLYIGALTEWHLGEIASCQATIAEAISLAEELSDMHGLALSLYFAGSLSHFQPNPAEVERHSSALIDCQHDTILRIGSLQE